MKYTLNFLENVHFYDEKKLKVYWGKSRFYFHSAPILSTKESFQQIMQTDTKSKTKQQLIFVKLWRLLEPGDIIFKLIYRLSTRVSKDKSVHSRSVLSDRGVLRWGSVSHPQIIIYHVLGITIIQVHPFHLKCLQLGEGYNKQVFPMEHG